MHAKMLPILLAGLLLATVAYMAGALDLPTVSPHSDGPIVTSADQPLKERSAALTPPLSLEHRTLRAASIADRSPKPAWGLAILFYLVGFGLMFNPIFVSERVRGLSLFAGQLSAWIIGGTVVLRMVSDLMVRDLVANQRPMSAGPRR